MGRNGRRAGQAGGSRAKERECRDARASLRWIHLWCV